MIEYQSTMWLYLVVCPLEMDEWLSPSSQWATTELRSSW